MSELQQLQGLLREDFLLPSSAFCITHSGAAVAVASRG